MKKILITAALAALSCIALYAQDFGGKVYCELVGTQKLFSTKVTVEVDFGQEKKPFYDHTLVDKKTGAKLVFNSMVDAMNYMGMFNWEFEQAYVVTLGAGSNGKNVYHWLLSKTVDYRGDIEDGITTKGQFKETTKTLNKDK